jgi:hypothetical protein
MRTFTAFCVVSAIVHFVLLLAVATPYQRQTAHGETMSVELVPASEAPTGESAASADAPAQAEARPKNEDATPDFSKLRLSETPKAPVEPKEAEQKPVLPPPEQKQQTQQPAQHAQGQQRAQQPPASQPQQQQPQAMLPQLAQRPEQQLPPPQQQEDTPEPPKISPEMTVETPADQYERLSALMNIPGTTFGPSSFGTEAETKAKLTDEEIAQFKAHLKTCWKLPAGVKESDKVKVVIRIALRPNGVLAAQPSLLEAAASELGLPVYKSGVAALKACAPYNMLPPEKYKEWRVLDINFSPDEMTRG